MKQLATAALQARHPRRSDAARSAGGIHRTGAAAGFAAFVLAVGARERLPAFSAIFEPEREQSPAEMYGLVQAFAWRHLLNAVGGRMGEG